MNRAIEVLKRDEEQLEAWGYLQGECAEVWLEQCRQAIADLEEKDMQRQMRREASDE